MVQRDAGQQPLGNPSMVVDVFRVVAAVARTEKAPMSTRSRQRLETWIAGLVLFALVLIGSALPYL
jgi:hypothetical protein